MHMRDWVAQLDKLISIFNKIKASLLLNEAFEEGGCLTGVNSTKRKARLCFDKKIS